MHLLFWEILFLGVPLEFVDMGEDEAVYLSSREGPGNSQGLRVRFDCADSLSQ